MSGALFRSSGLNQRYMPPPPPPKTNTNNDNRPDQEEEEEEFPGFKRFLDKELRRNSSPLARVYDMSNTGTGLLLLDRKHEKDASKLRNRNEMLSRPAIDPERHFIKRDWHYGPNKCLGSYPAQFHAHARDVRPVQEGQDEETEAGTRPSTAVNQLRHISCRTANDLVLPPPGRRSQRACSAPARPRRPHSIQNNYYLNHPGLQNGQRWYLWNVAQAYSMDQLRALRKKHYDELLMQVK